MRVKSLRQLEATRQTKNLDIETKCSALVSSGDYVTTVKSGLPMLHLASAEGSQCIVVDTDPVHVVWLSNMQRGKYVRKGGESSPT